MKRWLFLLHRWLGVFGCLLIALWFASGFVMMYMPFPELTDVEHFAQREDLDLAQVRVTPAEAIARTQTAVVAESGAEPLAAPLQLRLFSEGKEPRYALRFGSSGWVAVDAVNGEVMQVDDKQATQSALRFARHHQSIGTVETLLDVDGVELLARDQWTVPSKYDAHRPLYAVRMHDGAVHYVSSRTGEVVLDTTRWERGWNWVGAVVHWVYPTVLRSRPPVWHWVVIVLSGYALLTAVLGVILGILRWKRYASGKRTPYTGVMRWHHVLGLVCAMFVISWLFSGLLSMNPGDVFASRNVTPQQVAAWRGGALSTTDFALQLVPGSIPLDQAVTNAASNPKEIEWFADARGALAWLRFSDSDSRLLRTDKGVFTTFAIDADYLAQHVNALVAAKESQLDIPNSIERLDDYDNYYDARTRSKPLPIWRIQFNDPHSTWLHVHGRNGQLLGKLDASNRTQRWLYNGLHSWDLTWFITRRPIWDIAMIAALVLGLVFAGTSVVIAWRRVRRKMG